MEYCGALAIQSSCYDLLLSLLRNIFDLLFSNDRLLIKWQRVVWFTCSRSCMIEFALTKISMMCGLYKCFINKVELSWVAAQPFQQLRTSIPNVLVGLNIFLCQWFWWAITCKILWTASCCLITDERNKVCILSVATQYPVLWHSAVALLSTSSLTSFIAFYIFTSSPVILLFGQW